MFLRSRAVYKGSKIDWDIDECSDSLPKPKKIRKELTTSKKPSPIVNRFELLDMEGSGDGSLEDGHSTSLHKTVLVPLANGDVVD
jgi:hypothetical protein